MQDRLQKIMLICGSVFFFLSMVILLYVAKYKAINIKEVSQDQITNDNLQVENVIEQKYGKQLKFQKGDKKNNYLCIPLPTNTRAEAVSIENYYMDQKLVICVSDVSKDFYETNTILDNSSKVTTGNYIFQNGKVKLVFDLKEIFECKSVLEEDFIYIEFVTPREIYDKIIVIDAGHGGKDQGICQNGIKEKEFTLDIVKRIKKELDDSDIKVYYTRMSDEEISSEKRIEIANKINADLFISIHLNEDSKDTAKYGVETTYNNTFFIPQFGSLELADLLEREVTTEVCGKGNGLFQAKENEVEILQATIPAALIRVGYVTNLKEVQLLKKDSYKQQIADGIVDAIFKAYDEKEE